MYKYQNKSLNWHNKSRGEGAAFWINYSVVFVNFTEIRCIGRLPPPIRICETQPTPPNPRSETATRIAYFKCNRRCVLVIVRFATYKQLKTYERVVLKMKWSLFSTCLEYLVETLLVAETVCIAYILNEHTQLSMSVT